ncbi:MAG TPA: ABC transporter permease [Terriglobales bacterium]|nr:ABC transporter permease [Terriglobales bacterium]
MDNIFQDLRYTLRQLLKTPGFTLTAVLTLALGIGANVAVFCVINATLLNPSGVPHPDQIVAVRARYSVGDLKNINISPTDFGDAVVAKNIFTSAAVMRRANFNYTASGTTPERLTGAAVSWQWFDVFWARPYLGRVFRPEEDQPGANHEAVLSYLTWKQRFGGDPGIIGRTLLLNQESYQVIGVAAPEFNWPNQAELWVPLALQTSAYFDNKNRYNEYLFSAARLRPGVTSEQANSFLAVKSAQLVDAEGQNGFGRAAGWGMFCMPLVDFVAGDLRKPLFLLLAAVMSVLMIACANIAGLQLARASGKQREVSIQIALGVTRSRLIRSAFLESLLLAVAGVVLGMLIASVSIPLLLLLVPTALASNITIHVGWPILLFLAAVAGACALLCGVAPAWQMTHSRWFQALQESGRSETSSRARQRLRSGLVIAEIAVAMCLLVGAGLLVRSLQQVQQLETGFNPAQLMSASISLPPTIYKNDEQQSAFFASAEDQLKNQSGIVTAAFADSLPFSNGGGSSSFSIKGRTVPPNDPGPHGNIHGISPDYFTALGIGLVRGRFFTPQDRLKTEPVAIVDETLAHTYWPNEDPIGQQINFGGNSPWMTIVGLVKHAKTSSLEADNTEGYYYLPIAQSPVNNASIVVRTASSRPQSAVESMRAAVRAVDANVPIYDLKTMEERVDSSMTGRRFLVVLLSIFAGLALLLAAVGLYGVITYSVRMRTRELGIRMALGAQRTDILRMILGTGMQLALAGLVLGFLVTFTVGRVLSSLLYRVSLLNPLTLIVTAFLLSSTVLFACYVPARRAAALEPMRTLRED